MLTSRLAIALVTLLMAGNAAAQAPYGVHVAGGVTDGWGGVLRGARVTVTGADGRRQAFSDASGRFDIGDVPPGDYVVTAELAGFEARMRRIILPTPGSRIYVPLTLVELCDRDLVVDQGFRDTVIQSDAILHARITGVEPTRGIRRGCLADAVTYTAAVVEGMKARAEDVERSTIRWVQDSDSAGPQSGQEYLVFLSWDATNSRYSAAGGLYVFPVRAGHVEWNRDDVPGIRDGDPVGHVTETIRGVLAPLRDGR